jgi:prepilin-type N-terminal cleavage/methylation domain-containing protein
MQSKSKVTINVILEKSRINQSIKTPFKTKNYKSQVLKISRPPRMKEKTSKASKGELTFKAQSFLIKTNSKKAFTLIELIVTITILAIL